MGRGTKSAANAGIDPTEPVVENVLYLRHGETIHENLADLWNYDEALTRDIQRLRLFDVAGQHKDQSVARPDLVAGVNRTR